MPTQLVRLHDMSCCDTSNHDVPAAAGGESMQFPNGTLSPVFIALRKSSKLLQQSTRPPREPIRRTPLGLPKIGITMYVMYMFSA